MNASKGGLTAVSRVHEHGFSLIEVLAVVALISVVMFVALNFYTDLARATARASNHTHDIRRAVAIMDRVASDFESAMLVVKPAEMDPISHPWLFIGESELGGTGADHVKFVTRNHDPTRSDNPESDIAVVAYTVEQDESGLLTLYRWSSPRLPEELDRSFPLADDDRSYPMAEGLETFGIQFVGADGGTTSDWDSTTLEQSGTLPAAVEIQVALASPDLDEDTEPLIYQRRVLIRVPPLDFERLLDPTGEGGRNDDEDGEEDGDDNDDDDDDRKDKDKKKETTAAAKTIGNCLDLSGVNSTDQGAALYKAFLSGRSSDPFNLSDFSPPQFGARVNPACR